MMILATFSSCCCCCSCCCCGCSKDTSRMGKHYGSEGRRRGKKAPKSAKRPFWNLIKSYSSYHFLHFFHLFGPTCGQPSHKNTAAGRGNTMAVKDGEGKKTAQKVPNGEGKKTSKKCQKSLLKSYWKYYFPDFFHLFRPTCRQTRNQQSHTFFETHPQQVQVVVIVVVGVVVVVIVVVGVGVGV